MFLSKQVLFGVFSAMLVSSLAQAKTLTIGCEGPNGASLELVSSVANVNTPQEIQSFKVKGATQSKLRDVSKMPIYKDGGFTLSINFGSNLYNSVQIQVEKCNDSFEATGTARVDWYVGGFAGTRSENYTCSCELK